MRKHPSLRITALMLALVCCLSAIPAGADTAPVLYEATATAACKIYQNADAGAKALATVPKGAKLYVTSPGIIQGADNYYLVLYQNTRGFAPSASIQISAASVQENEASIYVPVAYGDERSEVISLQEALKELGFYTGKEDGIFGAGTRKSVLAYQKANGLPETGAGDAATQKKLFEGKSVNSRGKSVSITTAPVCLDYTMASGHTGYAVKALQARLAELGYYKKAVDGQYGAGTVSAVKAYQKANRLTQTGKADSTTQRLLFSPSSVPSLTATPAPSSGSAYPFTTYTLSAVNLRKTASTSSLRLLTVPKGAEISVSSVGNEFVKATYKGKTGYLAIDYVQVPDAYLPGKTLKPDAAAQQKYTEMMAGAQGKEVYVMQEALKELGFHAGASDGLFGATTTAALKAFQKKNGLRQDGIASPEIQQLMLEGRPLNAQGKKTDVSILPWLEDLDLKQGDRGEQVAALQQQLIAVGVYTGQPTGTFDSTTAKAVKQFQREHSLYVDGIAGRKTRQMLDLMAKTPTPVPALTATPTPAAKTATPVPASTPLTEKNVVVMRRGVKGEAVKRLQERLMELKYYTCTVDGVYNDDDIAAVKAFQKKNNLTVDGVAGLQTQLALYSSRAVPATGAAPTATPVPGAYTIPVEEVANVLRIGNSGDTVRALQQRLAALGYYTGKIDGSFGTATAQAVTAFQKANKLTADGVAGPKTLSKLSSASVVAVATPKPAATATPAPIKATVLRSGDRGADVRAMQQRLVDLGYLKAADGIFGLQTYNAVAAFQRRNGLKADGIAGKLTLNKLNSSSALPASTASQTPAAAQAAASTAFKAPSASEVRNANWYSEIRSRAKLMPDVVIYDPDTGLHFNLHMFSFGKHADAEPPTAADTAVLNRICGVNSWTPHYVWVIFTDGRVYIGSIHSHGHSVDHTGGNNLEGHICLHFPRVMTEAEATGPYAVSHQKEILFGWEMTQAMAR